MPLTSRVHADDVVALGKAVGKHVTARRLGELDQMRVLTADDDGAVLAHRLMNLAKVASISSIPE